MKQTKMKYTEKQIKEFQKLLQTRGIKVTIKDIETKIEILEAMSNNGTLCRGNATKAPALWEERTYNNFLFNDK